MSFIPFAVTADDRRTKTMAPIVLQNMMLEQIPDGAPKAGEYMLTPWPGIVDRGAGIPAGALCRGLYAQPGVQDGVLFGVFGNRLYSFASDYSATLVGSFIAGAASGNIVWGYLRETLLILVGGFLYQWDGSSLDSAAVEDVDYPGTTAFTLTTLDQRAIVSLAGADQYYWSDVLDAMSWDPLSFATDERRPDEIIASGSLAGDLWFFGAKGTNVLRGGGSATNPFQSIRSVDINKGCAARDSVRLIQSSFFFLGDDRVVYRTDGYSPMQLSCPALELQLQALTLAELAQCISFHYQRGSKNFYVLRPPSGGAWAYDIEFGNWVQLSTWEADAYKIAFTANAYGKTFCSGPDQDNLYTFEPDVYSDDGGAVEKIATFSVPLQERAIIKSLVFDAPTIDVPLSGQGSSPEMMVQYWKDSGRYASGAAGVIRTCSLAARGQYNHKPNLRRMGLANPQDGLIVQCTVTDPVGMNFYGVRVNEPLP